MPLHGLVQDSPVIHVGAKAARRARRSAKHEHVAFLTPKSKAIISNWLDELSEKSKVMYAEAKEKRRSR
jgi:hypothetical protein